MSRTKITVCVAALGLLGGVSGYALASPGTKQYGPPTYSAPTGTVTTTGNLGVSHTRTAVAQVQTTATPAAQTTATPAAQTTATPAATSGGGLPFTGAPLVLVLLVGGLMIVGGETLRRLVRRRRSD